MDSVAHRDHISDFHHFCSLFGAHASRISEDLIIYFTSEFGWLKLPDAFCTGSSMMPQKKNPDVLELLRGKAGQLVGGYVDSLMLVKGTPLTFDRDFQEDKRALWRSCQAVEGMLEVMSPLFAEVKVDEQAARKKFQDGLIFATDVAEHLVTRGVPFREAHAMVGHIVRWCLDNNRPLTSLTPEEWKKFAPQASPELPSLLTPEISVSRRNSYGGTSHAQVKAQIERGRKHLADYAEQFKELLNAYPTMPAE